MPTKSVSSQTCGELSGLKAHMAGRCRDFIDSIGIFKGNGRECGSYTYIISVSGFQGFRDSTQRMETPKEKGNGKCNGSRAYTEFIVIGSYCLQDLPEGLSRLAYRWWSE